LAAVALDGGYECHACGREYTAGLIRVPRAWGRGGEEMAEAARLPLPFPQAAVVDAPTLVVQTAEIAAALPARPIVLGGCCCAHTGAISGLSQRFGRLGVVWLDAHGDLNTPETSPSGNAWGMPLREAIDAGDVLPGDVALIGARNLDPPEVEFIRANGIRSTVADAVAGVDAVYIAFDADVLDERVVRCFMPEPDGLGVAQAEAVLAEASRRPLLAGIGFTGLLPDPLNVELLLRLLDAVGLPSSSAHVTAPTKMRPMSSSRIDVSIEHKRADPERDDSKGHPNTCPSCGSHYREDELERHLRVCPHCGHHFPVRARERIAQLVDDGSFAEEDADLRSADPLGFFDLRPYTERLAEAELATGLGDAMVIGGARIEENACRIAVMDFAFMGGSMGSVVGEKFVRACESAAGASVPLVSVAASGGARMLEGILALMQLP
jgi:DNA-directed RNA polymerase subunit RPC12/RpoP